MNTITHSIIGLPSSGKTTFLAALWHILNSNEIDSKFTLERLVGDSTHLNTIADHWRRCVKVPRTSTPMETRSLIHVRNNISGDLAILKFPDLAGESFELQLTSRYCTEEYIRDFEGDGGILLFVTADRKVDGITISELPLGMFESEAIEAEATESDGAEPKTSEEELDIKPITPKEWSAELVPHQVKLVELLQFIQSSPFVQLKRKIAVIVSAWDLIVKSTATPESWLKAELPLLHQFLQSNSQDFEYKVYGISAQGGDFEHDDIDELADQIPSTRIICQGDDCDAHDLTGPILWLMSRG